MFWVITIGGALIALSSGLLPLNISQAFLRRFLPAMTKEHIERVRMGLVISGVMILLISASVNRTVTTELRNTATRDIPKPVAQSVESMVLSALRDWQIANTTTRVIGSLRNSKDRNAVTVFNNILDFLRKSGINYQQGGIVGSYISIGVIDRGVLPPEPPLTVQYHPNSETRAKALIAALSKYAHGETLFSPDPQHGENEIKLIFNGTPKFPYADGSVLLE